MRFLAAIIFLIFAGCTTNPPDDFRFSQASLSTSTYSANNLPDFSDFIVQAIYRGESAGLDFSNAPQLANRSEEISAWISNGSLFSGHYGIAQLGCGTACQEIIVVNLIDGLVRKTSVTSSLGVNFRDGSSLLVVNPPEQIAELFGNQPPEWIQTRYYVWTGFDFELLYKLQAGS